MQLPVHVNALFDTMADGRLDDNSAWNRVLIRDVVPVVHARLLLHLASNSDPSACGEAVQKLLPCCDSGERQCTSNMPTH